MKPKPQSIKAIGDAIAIIWADGHESRFTGRQLRLACRCAACIDEWTHEVRIRPETIPEIVKPLKIDVVGNYAFHVYWSDHHDTGIYTYNFLRELCDAGCGATTHG